MNKQMIRYVLGLVLLIEGALLLLPLAVALLYREASWIYFIATIGVCLALGGCMTLRKPQRAALFPKDGFVIAAPQLDRHQHCRGAALLPVRPDPPVHRRPV